MLELPDGDADDIADITPVQFELQPSLGFKPQAGVKTPGFQARHVEQIGNEPVEAVAGILEAAVAVLCIVSLVTLEILPGRSKPFLKFALGVSAITFMMLGVGQRITNEFDGAASLFFYFGATMATLLVVFRDEAQHEDHAPATA